MPARLRILRARGGEAGQGLIELLIAVTVMSVGILALFAMFESGMVQIRRASAVTTAAALADSEMEKYRALQYDAIGLTASGIAGADATYKADTAYNSEATPTTTLNGALSATATTVVVTSTTGFPTSPPFRIQVDSEIMLVTAVSGTTWTVQDSSGSRAPMDGTTAATHASGATVKLKQRVELPTCGSPAVLPCTSSVPTQTPTGADGRSYRLDTYMTWLNISNSGGTTGRQEKLVTIVIRDAAKPAIIYARVASTFDQSTGLAVTT
jgi:type II secretory pathway pseudopilin PulG